MAFNLVSKLYTQGMQFYIKVRNDSSSDYVAFLGNDPINNSIL
ncbi:hypothetical protein PRUB_b0639 [Pseudoalteromonas rubra]|uniref:Uncharacterized protein n=1 Tax=Pseudoalteromonas rubra TaxID=43658 RepID=A0A8T0C2F2_9GAMM|nr:hypothetical protein PRUB_b0639 [Pseudoalteromonas rubra]